MASFLFETYLMVGQGMLDLLEMDLHHFNENLPNEACFTQLDEDTVQGVLCRKNSHLVIFFLLKPTASDHKYSYLAKSEEGH